MNRLISDLVKALPFAIAATIVVWAFILLTAFNSTASEPYGFYLRIPYLGGALEKDDLVQIKNPAIGLLGVTEEHLLKTVDSVNDDGSIYVLGTSPDSFDSRFFGAVDKSNIEAVCYPIVTSEKLETFSGYIKFVNFFT